MCRCLREMRLATIVSLHFLIFELILITSVPCEGNTIFSLHKPLKPVMPEIRFHSQNTTDITRVHNNVFHSGGNSFFLTLECHAFYPIYWSVEDDDLDKQFNGLLSSNKRILRNSTIYRYSFTTTMVVEVDPELLRRLVEVKYSCKSVEIPCMQNTVYIHTQPQDNPHTIFVNSEENSRLLKQYINCPWRSTTGNDTIPHLKFYPIYAPYKDINNKNCQDALQMDVNGLKKNEIFIPANDSITVTCRSHKGYLALGGHCEFTIRKNLTTMLKSLKAATTSEPLAEYYETIATLPISKNRPIRVSCSVPLWNSYSWCNATITIVLKTNTEFTPTTDSSVVYSSTGAVTHNLIEANDNMRVICEICEIANDTYNQNQNYSKPSEKDVDTAAPFFSLAIIGIIIASTSLLICVILTFIIYIYTVVKRKREKNQSKEYLPELKVLMTPKNPSFSDSCEIASVNLKIDKNSILGQGTFGVVYKAVLSTQSFPLDVAVKTSKDGSEFAINSLKKELKVISKMKKHINIVQLIGAVTENIENGTGSISIVLEYCANGNLRDYLRINKSSFKNISVEDHVNMPEPINFQNDFVISATDLVSWALDISRGMQFLSSHKIVHGDLACRNVLLSANRVAKLTDFGLAKQLEEYYYVNKKEVPMPWKWMAYESLQYQKFSTKTDIWSFGITLWEIFSLGDSPWLGCQWGEEFLQTLTDGVRPKKTEYCPDEIYKLMEQCWRIETVLRPRFNESAEQLQMILKKLTNKEKLEKGVVENREAAEKSKECENYYYLIPIQPKKL